MDEIIEHHERREYNLQMAQDIGQMKGMLESLAGPQGRVTALERASTRQWWFSIGIAPFLTLAHAALRKFGVDV